MNNEVNANSRATRGSLGLEDIEYSCPLSDISVSLMDNGGRRRLAAGIASRVETIWQQMMCSSSNEIGSNTVMILAAWHWVLHWVSDKPEPQATVVQEKPSSCFAIVTEVSDSTTLEDLQMQIRNQWQLRSVETLNLEEAAGDCYREALTCHRVWLDENADCEQPAEIQLCRENDDWVIDCAASCVSESYQRYLIQLWQSALMAMAGDRSIVLAEMPLYTWSEKQQREFGLSGPAVAITGNLIDRFNTNLARSPEKTAVLDSDQLLTYRQLDQLSDRWAQQLVAEGVRKGMPVGLAFDRSVRMVAAQLAVLKVGGIFVPMDAGHPQSRLESIQEDTGLCHILTEECHRQPLQTKLPMVTLLCVESYAVDSIDQPSQRFTPVATVADDIAYIIFTSGSTGKPKGVRVSHGNLINFLAFMNRYVGESDVSTQFAPFTFDASVAEIHAAVLNGGTLVMLSRDHIENPDRLQQFLSENQVTFSAFPPSYAKHLSPEKLPHQKTLLTAGSAPDHEFIARWQPHLTYINAYGPTETTILSTLWEADGAVDAEVPIVMGSPINNTRIELVNRFNHMVPPGFVGELIIGGAGVTHGYMNRVEMTEEKFSYRDSTRWYRSGDLVCQDAQGQLIFYGRVDKQVKLRGHRLELGEVETAIKALAGIEDAAAVVTTESLSAQLYVYCVGAKRSEDDFRHQLAELLPQWALPNRVYWVGELPMTVNGKVDYRALLEDLPDIDATGRDDYIMTELEKAVSSLWENVLQVPQVTLKDNFIHLGGDSLTALVVASSLKKMGYVISSSHLLEHPVFEDFVSSLDNFKSATSLGEPYPVVNGEVLHSAIQSWFFSLPLNHPNQFCQSLVVESRGVMDGGRLGDALQQLSEYHDVLRTRVEPVIAGRGVERISAAAWRQQVMAVNEFHPALVVESVDGDIEAATEEMHGRLTASIEMNNGALWQAGLLNTVSGSRLVLVFHHLLMDTVSHSVLLDDLYQLYSSEAGYQQLPAKTLSYSEWAALQQQHIADSEADIFSQWQPTLEEDRSCHRISDAISPFGNLAEKRLVLDTCLSEQLAYQATGCYRQNPEDMVLAATLIGLARTFGKKRIGIDIEWHGRDEAFAGVRGISRTLGWFTSVHPLFMEVDGDNVGNLLVDLKEKRAAVPNRGRDFYSLKYFASDADHRDVIDGFCGPDVLFNFSGVVQRRNSEWKTVPVAAIEMGSSDEYIPYNLSVETELRDGQLNLHIFYNADVISGEAVEKLLLSTREAAGELVQFCAVPDHHFWTPSDFPLLAISRDRARELPATISAAYPLTDMQQTMYHYQQQYQVWMYYRLPRKLDAGALSRAIGELVRKHDCLRTCIKVWGSQTVQLVLKDWQPEVDFHWAGNGQSQVAAEQLIAEARKQPVSVVESPAVHFDVIDEGGADFLVLLSIHHLNHDGWSINLIFEALFDEYRFQLGEIKRASPTPVTTMETVVRSQLALKASDQWNHYWQSLPWEQNVCELPARTGAKDSAERQIQIVLEDLDDDLVASVRQQAHHAGVTVNALWMTAYACLLRFIGRSRQVRFGVIQSGRMESIPGIDTVTGCCINTLPMVLNLEAGTSLRTVVAKVAEQLGKMRESVAFPLSQIQALAAEQAGAQLFESLFNIESHNYAGEKNRERPQLEGGFESTNSALTFSVIEGEEGFGLRVGYDTSCFAESDIHQLMASYTHWLQLLVAHLDSAWNSLDALSESQTAQLIHWNSTTSRYPKESHLWHLFTQQAQEQGNKIALWEARPEGDTLAFTYSQLQTRAEQLARRINLILPVARHREAIVGVFSERSADAVVAWLALARLGYAYLPLDPKYPADRLQHMLTDAGCQLVLTQNRDQFEQLPGAEHFQTMALDQASLYQGELPAFDEPVIDSNRLAYVMYTSGSTGKPKGVMIEQAAIIRLIKNTGYAPLSADDHILLTGAPVFDATTYEVWGSLLNGGTLSIVDEQVLLDTEQLAGVLRDRGITTLWLTAPLFNQHVQQQPAMFSGLNQLLVGGDALSVEHIRLARRANPELTVINGYGPTENTTFSVCHRMEAGEALGDVSSIPIGKPIHNSTAHVVNDAGQPVPVGVCGELWVGGDGVARGYLNREQLTAEKFIADPFSDQPGARLYKTGDLVRWTRDGVIEFIGRVDDQVKIRGFRIELGEIDTALTRHPLVEEARVLVKQDGQGNKQLVGYVAMGAALDSHQNSGFRAELQSWLAESLPDYMVPAALVLMDKLPLNKNGKVDRKLLPEPEFACDSDSSELIADSETEITLLQVISQVLWRDCRNITADFFSIGGSSLDAVKLIAEIRAVFSVDLNVGAIFNAVNLRELATLIDQQIEAASEPPMSDEPDLDSLSDSELDAYLQQLTSEQGV